MQKMLFSLRELAFRFKLYLFGVRFYEVHSVVEEPIVHESNYSIGGLFQIHFDFRRMICNDFVLRRGCLVAESYNSYIVTAKFNNEVPEAIQKLNNKPFFFNGVYNDFGIEEHRTLDLIADIYLDFLKSVVKSSYCEVA